MRLRFTNEVIEIENGIIECSKSMDMAETQNNDNTPQEDIDRLKKIMLFISPIVTLSVIGYLAYLGFVESLGLLIFIFIAIALIVSEIVVIKMIFRALDDQTQLPAPK